MFQGDCREVIPDLGMRFDAVIADPPYGVTPIEWDKRVKGWARVVREVLKPTGSMWVFGSLRSLLETWSEFEGWKLAQDIVWEKPNGSGPTTHRRWVRVHEHVVQLYRADAKWRDVYANPVREEGFTRKAAHRKITSDNRGDYGEASYDSTSRLPRSVVKVAPPRFRERWHPTQKPEALVRRLLEYSCPPGGLVLDPFAGSGVTAIAADGLGIGVVGIDIEPVG